MANRRLPYAYNVYKAKSKRGTVFFSNQGLLVVSSPTEWSQPRRNQFQIAVVFAIPFKDNHLD